MANLKDLKNRISSVKSTRKITKAMQMVAAAKLRRAQESAEAARPYAERMERMLASLGAGVAGQPDAPRLLLQLVLTYTDGHTSKVSTGPAWRALAADHVFRPRGNTGAFLHRIKYQKLDLAVAK